jgi:hypothetical protein
MEKLSMTIKDLGLIFMGGSGRSGTSVMARRFGMHQQICSFTDIELKIFCEFGGIYDLYNNLCINYSPNRAEILLRNFRAMFDALILGKYGQLSLDKFIDIDEAKPIVDQFLENFIKGSSVVYTSTDDFRKHLNIFIQEITRCSLKNRKGSASVTSFLEKTPHNILFVEYLYNMFPSAKFLHITRDPRSVANSLLKMNWGPSDPQSSCHWVSSYYKRWLQIREQAKKDGINIYECYIEDFARNPNQENEKMLNYLELDPFASKTQQINLETLNGWVKRESEDYLDIFRTMLKPVVTQMEYCEHEIGLTEKSDESKGIWQRLF